MSDDVAPRISVLIPAYGLAQLVGESLASLQAQDCGAWEAIVVDDGDGDAVGAALAAFQGDPRIRHLRTSNGGVSAARNKAAAIARAPIIALLDGDDLFAPDYLSTVLRAFEADATLALLTCDATYFGLPDRTGKLFSEWHTQAAPFTLANVLARDFNVYIGSAFRRSAFEAVGGFDETLGCVEDLDLWIRLMQGEGTALYIPRPLGRYRRRPNSLSSNAPAMAAAEQTVYEKAHRALHGRLERIVAEKRLAALAIEQAWRDGERLIREGDVRGGLARLKGREAQSLRWRVALPLMRAFPTLVGPLFRLRAVLPEPARQMPGPSA